MRFAPAGQAPPPCTVILRSAQDFWLKYQDSARMLRRVTLTKLYRRAVMINSQVLYTLNNFLKN